MPSEPNAASSGVIEHGAVPPVPPPPPQTKPVKKQNGGPAQTKPAAAVAAGAIPPPPKPQAKSAAAAPPTKKKPPAAPSAEDLAESRGRATRPTWLQMVVVYGTSMVLHVLVLVVLGLIVLPAQVREELLNVLVEVKEPEPVTIDTEVAEPEPLEEQTVEEEVVADANSLVESETDAVDKFNLDISDAELSLKADVTDGPSLPIKKGDVSAGRSQAARGKMLAERGGSNASDAAVGAALQWLASVQRRDGSWDFTDVGKSSQAGTLSSPTGATGMALMAFLGAGHTHMKSSHHKETVSRGINYLLKAGIPRPAGLDFRGPKPGNDGMYVQAIVATALAEAHGMTNDRRLRPVAQGATNFIVRAQHSGGGWRYRPNQAGDTSVVGWQVMALKSAYHAKIPIPRTVAMGVKKFLDDVSSDNQAKYAYTPGSGPKPSTTSIGLLCRMYMGWKVDNPALKAGVQYLAKLGPSKRDIYYDYYASQVMIQFTGAKGPVWDKWNIPLRDWLVATQQKTGPEKGSWNNFGGHGGNAGRIYNTCMAVMNLEIYYRVLPLYQRAGIEGEF